MYVELMNKNEVTLAKHSAVIQISNKISAIQRKCYNAFLYSAKKQLEENPGQFKFKIDAKVLLDFFQLGDKNYNILKEKLKELRKIEVEYNILGKDKKQNWGSFNILAGIEYKDSKFIFSFPHQVLECLINPNVYTYIDLVIIKDLKSKYAIALYELLKDYKEIKELIIEIDKFRKLMGIKENQYTMFSTFRDKVINRAVSEINESEKIDFKVEYELRKSGRKYSHIKFLIKKIAKKEIKNQAIIESNKLDYLINLVNKEFQSETIKKILLKAINEHDIEYIKSQIEYTNKQESINNYIAYLKKAIKEDYADYQNKAERERKAKEEREKIRKQEEEYKKRLKELLEIKKQIEEECEKEFNTLPVDEQERLIKRYMGIMGKKSIAKMSAIGELITKKMQEKFTSEELELLENYNI